MRSAAETTTAALKRGVNLLEQVDYRLAQTPDEKEEIYYLRYRAYLREGAVKASAEQRVTDQYDDLPNSWTFGVYLQDELHSSVRISLLTSEWRQSCSAEAFGEILMPRLDRGGVIVDPARFVADPAKAGRLPGLLKPVGLMAADFPAMRNRVFARYPMMRSTAFERRMLFERPGERHLSARNVRPSQERTAFAP